MGSATPALDLTGLWDGRQVLFTASPAGLQDLIFALNSKVGARFELPLHASPDCGQIGQLKVEPGSDRIALRLSEGVAMLSGNQKSLGLLASNLERLGEQWRSGQAAHAHHDHDSNPFLIHQDSVPFIVSPRGR